MTCLKTLTSIILLLSLSLLYVNGTVAATKSVWGWAWIGNSSNANSVIGWISFNSINCDPNQNGIYEGAAEGAPTGCPTSGTVHPYKVEIDSITGILSGYAWSSNIGWISFNRIETGAPPTEDPCFLAGNCIAKVDFDSTPKKIIGWGRACGIPPGGSSIQCGGGGWDGWIKLAGTISSDGPYKVWAEVPPSPSPAQLHSYAWGGNETNGDWIKKAVVGWVSFNCKEGGIVGGDICASKSDYKVLTSFNFNRAPSATNLNVTNDPSQYCFNYNPYPPIWLNWTFFDQDSGDSQTAYRVQVTTDPTFSSITVDSLETTSPSQSYSPPNLAFNTAYYWRVMVWDSKGEPSADWIYPPSPAGSPTPKPGSTFTTLLHRFPWPSFTYTSSPSAGEVVNFDDTSECWSISDPVNSFPCPNSSDVNLSYLWDFGDGYTDGTKGDTTHTFGQANDYAVSLTVRDNAGTCTETVNLTVQLPLPEWKEIPPTSMISKFLANVSSFLKNFLTKT